MIESSTARRSAHTGALIICFGISMLEGYDIQALGVAAPAIGAALHMSKSGIGIAGSATQLGMFIGALVGGWLADKEGRKPILVASVAWFGLLSLATTLVRDAQMLILARFVTGLGFGGATANMIAVAMEVSPALKRASTVTLICVGQPLGGSLAALLLGLAPIEFDWRLIFAIGGSLPMLLAPLARWLLPETRATCLQEAGVTQGIVRVLFGEGRALPTLLMWVAFALTLLALYIMLNWLPSLVIAKGLPRQTAGFAAMALNFGGIAGGIVLGRIIDRAGFRWPLAAATLGLVGVLAALARATGSTSIITFSAMTGFLLPGTQECLYAMAPHYYAARVRGLGSGAAVAAGRIGSIVGPGLAGIFLAGGASAAQVVQALIPIIVAGGLATFLLTVFGKPATD